MKWVIYITTIAVTVILDQTLFRVIDFGFFVPDLLLLFTLAVVWSFNNYDYIIFGLLGGAWLEVFAGLPMGSYSLGLILIGSIAYVVVNKWLFSEKPWQFFLGSVILGTTVVKLWLWLYVNLLANMELIGITLSFSMVWKTLLPTLLANLLLIYPVFASIEIAAKYLQNFTKNKLQL